MFARKRVACSWIFEARDGCKPCYGSVVKFPKAGKANGSNKWNAVNPGKHQAGLIPKA